MNARYGPDAGYRLRQAAVALVLSALVATPAVAASFELPPLVDPASSERHPGKAIFAQLVTPDLAAAKKFYAGLFGWSFKDIADTREPYSVATMDGAAVAGIAQLGYSGHDRRYPAWLTFFSTSDVDASVKEAAGQGARVLAQPHSLPGFGREAVLADPQGAVFALLASSSGDPPDTLSPPGDWIWRALLTTDPVADAVFYHNLFGFESFPLALPAGGEHLILASGNYARASANTLPASRPYESPHWVNFVRVEDTQVSVDKAVALGGQVLVKPRSDRYGGRIAVVADPFGAAVGVYEWSELDTKKINK